MPTRKPKSKAEKALNKNMKNVASKRKRTTVTKAPTKVASKLTSSPSSKRNISVPKSIAKEQAIKAGEKAASKIKGKDYISLMRIKKDYGDASSKKAEQLGYKTTGSLAYSGSKLKRVKPTQGKVTGVKSKTVGKPSTSKTVSKRSYRKKK